MAVQQLEGNVLSPMLQSKSSDLHAAVVLLSIALGSTLFGIVGAFLAVPVVATAAVILRYLTTWSTAKSPGGPDPESLPEPPGVVEGDRVDRRRARRGAGCGDGGAWVPARGTVVVESPPLGQVAQSVRASA